MYDVNRLDDVVVLRAGSVTLEQLNDAPGAAVILTVPPGREETAVPFLCRKVRGVVHEDAPEELELARQAVRSGAVMMPGTVMKRLLARAAPTPHDTPREPTLTERERQVLRLLAQGRSNREMSEALGVALVTVKKYVQSLLAKMGATDRTHAAVLALRIGLVD